ncbi:alpha/beta hydrolase [Nonomuraea sp. NN258]|uniref:alpha/beta fold hydrolase n=1 Tax=Nonomuraea antri TaxID=2730852 RepID=UPI001568ACE6|nr:alpha/beta hydrolase [Nonomuraea antri]NRQ33492.1 alpha/beta hydrolase [Nonomuraea antri]
MDRQTHTVSSADGTTLAYDRLGHGPAVVLISGGPSDRTANQELAELLSAHCTVYNYDRRGRGESGDTPPYSAEREYEDLAAVISAAGDSAALVGNSGTGLIALEAAARGLPVSRLALWEPPFVVADSRTPIPADWGRYVDELVQDGRPGDALAYWMTTVVEVPAEYVTQMRTEPFWAAMEPNAHLLVRDAALLRDFSLDLPRVAQVTAPVLVLDGDSIPWVNEGVEALVAALPNAEHRRLPGQPHDLPMKVFVEAIAGFLTA